MDINGASLVADLFLLCYESEFVVRYDPTEVQLNKANSLDTEATFVDLDLSLANVRLLYNI